MPTEIADSEKNIAVNRDGMIAITSDEAKTYSPEGVFVLPMELVERPEQDLDSEQ